LASDGSEIRAVEARIYRCPVGEPFGYAKGFIDARESAVARVVTADGTVGWGEAYAPGVVAETAAAITALGRGAIGRSVFERSQFVAETDASWQALAAAGSALALASLDAAGKLLNQSASAMLGGVSNPPLRSYASSLWFRPVGDATAHYGDGVREARDRGFAAVKAKLGLGVEADLRAIARLSDAADGIGVMLDANQAYDVDAAEIVATAAAEAGCLWLEEPLPPDRLSAYAALQVCSRVAIAGGETISSVGEAERWFDAAAVAILQPDPCLVGGLEAAVAVTEAAQRAGVAVAPHCYGLGIGLAASLHLAAIMAKAGDGEPIWIEVDAAPHPARDALLAGCDWFADGGVRLAVPTQPGLGIDPECIERFRVR
jgi:D-galactarolactone cycloisomerase